MKIELRLGLHITRAEKSEPVFEHRDAETLVENNGDRPVGFTMPHFEEGKRK